VNVGKLARRDVTGLSIARDENKLYALATSGEVTALTLTGEIRWTWTGNQVLLSGCALNATGDKVYVGGAKGDVIALHTESGQVAWQTPLTAEVLSVSEYAGRVFARTANGRLQALDANDGRLLWVLDHDLPALSIRGIADPVFVSNAMLLGWEDGSVELILQANGERIWEKRIALPRGRTDIERMTDVQAGILFDGTRLYAAATQGKLTAMDVQSGSTLWHNDSPTFVSMALGEDRLFVVTPDDSIKAIATNSGRGLWIQDALKHRRLSQLALWGDWIIAADMEGVLHLLSAQTGELVGRAEKALSGQMANALMLNQRELLILDTAGKLTQWQLEKVS
jgi:outer membrane protein assembly factor BamB